MLIDAGDLRRSQEQASQIGAAVGGGIMILIGIVIIILHFVRKKRD
ncbi:MAG: hypothetical protein ACKVHO_21320 [Verrucomicrobiia bacterium]|jgi:UDP-N-acetylmuramyl pentapeptide phosphotransferase/UDP-N-acetylglucosamine-1-phosphate transferase